jgi:hypothetical protein
VKEAECSGKIMYSCMKIEVETIPGMKLTGIYPEGIKESDGSVNSTMIHCKNFCNCHNIFPVQLYNNFKSC